MTETSPAAVLRFWIDEVGEAGWYRSDAGVDAEARARFGALWQAAHDRREVPWRGTARGALAACILLDQLPRNMFRDDARAFATDDLAREAAQAAIVTGADFQIPRPERQFFYLPFMHAEWLPAQDRGVALCERGLGRGENHLHARAHREVIARFGRFPHRNAVLGRTTSFEEQAFLDDGGYGGVVRRLRGGT